MTTPRDTISERGATLVELMISLLLFSILAAGTFVALSSQQESSRRQTETTGLLDAARSSLNALALQIASIKSGMPFGVAVLNVPTEIPSPAPTLCSSYIGTRPFELPASVTVPTGPNLVPVIEVTNSDTGPDQIRLLSPSGAAWGGLSTTLAPAANWVDIYTTTGAAPALVSREYAMVTNYDKAMVFRVGAPGPTTVGCGTGPVCMAKTSGTYTDPASFAPGNTLLAVRWQTFKIDKFMGRNALLVRDASAGTDEPVALDIEDLQVALGIDGADGSTPDGRIGPENTTAAGADEWVFNVAGESLGSNPDDACKLGNLRAVRITLVARASAEQEGAKVGVPAIEGRAARAPDGFYRVILTTTVAVRQ